MKKVMKVLMLAAVFAVFAFAPVSEAEVKTAPLEADEICVEEEGIRCVLRDKDTGQITASCWFCRCKNLFENLKDENQ